MNNIVRDSNGTRTSSNVKKENGSWGVNVWFGGVNGLGTNVRRYYYHTREQAREGNIAHDIGKYGRIK